MCVPPPLSRATERPDYHLSHIKRIARGVPENKVSSLSLPPRSII